MIVAPLYILCCCCCTGSDGLIRTVERGALLSNRCHQDHMCDILLFFLAVWKASGVTLNFPSSTETIYGSPCSGFCAERSTSKASLDPQKVSPVSLSHWKRETLCRAATLNDDDDVRRRKELIILPKKRHRPKRANTNEVAETHCDRPIGDDLSFFFSVFLKRKATQSLAVEYQVNKEKKEEYTPLWAALKAPLSFVTFSIRFCPVILLNKDPPPFLLSSKVTCGCYLMMGTDDGLLSTLYIPPGPSVYFI